MPDARDLIERLDLRPHPEGGWYRETWRAPAAEGERAAGTAIYFLLEEGRRSHWHRVDASEIWLWHAGSPLALSTAEDDDAQPWTVTLGPDIAAGQHPQHVIPAGHWQVASAEQGWVLVSCIVAPGFEFSGFELAAEGWTPG